MASQIPSLIVVPGSADNIPQVLDRLDFSYQVVDTVEAAAMSNALRNCRALFVACMASCEVSQAAAARLLTYVAGGGAIYISDLASVLVDRLFPGKVSFAGASHDSAVPIQVLDPGLAEIIGGSITLVAGEAMGIDSITQDVRVLLQGPRSSDTPQVYPYLILINHGDGQVIYTVFHNSAQVGETEKRLLDYLIFRPILSAAAGRAVAIAAAQMATPGKEIFAAINPAGTSARYGINALGVQTLLFVLSWEGSASLGLQVWDPAGSMFKDVPGTVSPLVVEVPGAAAGVWTTVVKGLRVPQRNFPYVLTIATRSTTSAAALRAIPTTPASASAEAPIYLVLDGSQKASDIASALETGVRRLVDRLRARPLRNIRPALGLLLADQRGHAVVPLTDVTRFIAPSLKGQGSCGLGGALTLLLRELASRPAQPKPLVAVLLAGPPTDDWIGPADQLRALASQGKANTFVFGLGSFAYGSVLRRLTPMPPLALSVVTPANVDQLFDWLYGIADVMLSGIESGASGTRSVPLPPSCLRQVT